MAIPVSTAPAVKAYLFAQLSAQVWPAATGVAAVQVTYDHPGPYMADDIVSVGDLLTRTCMPAAMVGSGGAKWLDEVYQLEVTVDVFRGADYAQTAFERAFTLMAVVESVVRTDPFCGGLVIEARPLQSTSSSEWDDEHLGRRVRMSLSIEVLAQI